MPLELTDAVGYLSRTGFFHSCAYATDEVIETAAPSDSSAAAAVCNSPRDRVGSAFFTRGLS